MKNKLVIFFTILVATILIYLPIITDSNILLNRGNDLQEYSWPIINYIKNNITENHFVPLWNNMFMSGMPLVNDPQSRLFYLPNIIFLATDIGHGYIISFILHTFLGAIAMYFLAREIGLNKVASTFASLLYIFMPRLSSYLEAGHFGLILSTTWLPMTVLFLIKLLKKPNTINAVFLSVATVGIYYTHATTFMLAVPSLVIITLLIIITKDIEKENILAILKYLLLASVIAFGLAAIALLPQLEWVPLTSRSILLENRQVHPIWTSPSEFIKALFLPWAGGINSIWNLNTEKWITVGIFPIILAAAGFFVLPKKLKAISIGVFLVLLLIILNNYSPIYSLLLSQDWYIVTRVSTRTWFVVWISLPLLAGLGLQSKILSKRFLSMLAIIALIEYMTISYIRILKPISDQSHHAKSSIFEKLTSEDKPYRVFCTTRCLSQRQSSIEGIQLVEGYSTLQQLNYIKQSWTLTGSYWDYYSLAIPPHGTYIYNQPQPDPKSLGEYNTKYVISPYKLTNKNFKLINKDDKYLIYTNKLFKSRSSSPIISYAPGHIRVDTSSTTTDSITLSEVYNPSWKALTDAGKLLVVQEKPNSLLYVDVPENTRFVDFSYAPKTYELGKYITIATIISLPIIVISKRKDLF